MKPFLLISSLIIFISCSNNQKKSKTSKKQEIRQQLNILTDLRDGEIYKTVVIANKTWMAENLRYNSLGSIINTENPSKTYGRLYTITSLQKACPKGWHLPSDKEWDELEIAHGMPTTFIGKSGWRGEHAVHMRTIKHWNSEIASLQFNTTNLHLNNTNKLQFNVLPAGYFASGKIGLPKGFEGLGFAAAFWSSTENNIATARFMFREQAFVNKWEDKNNETSMALSCRCVKD